MKFAFSLLTLLLIGGCTPNPYSEHYIKTGTLHPDLKEIHKQECLDLGFRNGTTAMAECRKEMAQDWKNNYEANRRFRQVRPSFGFGYGYGHRGSHIGIGHRW